MRRCTGGPQGRLALIVRGGRLRSDRRKRAVDGFEDRLAFGKAGFVKHAEAYGAAGRCVGSADSRASTPEAAPDAGNAQRVTMPVDCSENGRMPVDNLHSRVREVAA